MRCGRTLHVPEAIRAAALDFPHGLPDDAPLPSHVLCELDQHPRAEHAALLRDLDPDADGGAVWVTWEPDEIKVRRLEYCASRSPSRQDQCWLHHRHQGDHTWKRHV
jgi:hypothetical protein